MTPRRVELVVVGRVQGVCYRASTQEKAHTLGLLGTVENQADGSVRVVAEGEPAALDALVEWCRRGPPFAQVDDLSMQFSDAVGCFTGFTILR